MSHLAVVQKKEGFTLSPEQKKFHRLQKQLIDLEQKYNEKKETLEGHLTFYYTQIQPLHEQICDLWKEEIKIIYKHSANKKLFNPHEKRSIFQFLSHLFHELSVKSNALTLDEDLSLIFEKVEGISHAKLMAEGFAEIQEMVDEVFAKQGVKIDLTDFDYSGTEEEILQRLFDKIGKQSDPTIKPPKSPKEEELEFKKMQLENLKKKGLSSIYKQLAKAFHPDLEIDPVQKTEKESLMKKLTLAYEENDLNTLLLLERQWFKKSDTPQTNFSLEQLIHYNAILKEQIFSLKQNLLTVTTEPKYYPLQRYHRNDVEKIGAHLTRESNSLKKQIPDNKNFIKKLRSPEAIKTIKNIIYS